MLERDAHRLEARAVGRREQVLHERIDRARRLGDDLERRHVRRGAHRVCRDSRRIAEVARDRLAAVDLRDQLACLGERQHPARTAVKRSGVMA